MDFASLSDIYAIVQRDEEGESPWDPYQVPNISSDRHLSPAKHYLSPNDFVIIFTSSPRRSKTAKERIVPKRRTRAL